MGDSLRDLVFSNKEQQCYTYQFDLLTVGQGKSITERELTGSSAALFFKVFHLEDSELSLIWSIVSEGSPYLKLVNFMAAMRLCSVLKQGGAISFDNLKNMQRVLVRTHPTDEFVKKGVWWDKDEYFRSGLVESLGSCSDSDSGPDYLSDSEDLVVLGNSGEISDVTFTLTVMRPYLVNKGWLKGSGHYMYPIVTCVGGVTVTVKRRFRDIEWLHKSLVTAFKGLSIPPLPEKALIFNKNEEFIEERRKEIEAYLLNTASHKIVGKSEILSFFLYTPDGNFSSRRPEMSKFARTEDFEDILDNYYVKIASTWESLLNKTANPCSPEITHSTCSLPPLIASTELLINSYRKYSFHSVRSRNAVTSLLQPLTFEPPAPSRNPLEVLLKQELLKIQGLFTAISAYKQEVAQVAHYKTLLTRQASKKDSATRLFTFNRYSFKVSQTSEKLVSLAKSLESIEANLLSEISSFRTARALSLESTLSHIVATELALATSEEATWNLPKPN